MPSEFFNQPILNSPYGEPLRHWELDGDGRPTQRVVGARRSASFVSPIPRPQKSRGRAQGGEQMDFGLYEDDTTKSISGEGQKYRILTNIDALRNIVAKWRDKDYDGWPITAETARLLRHWRHHDFSAYRPFFCQLEAAEIAIWLTEVAPRAGSDGRQFIEYLREANEAHNPGLDRIALKLATGAGKTAVMAMLIAWQTINALRHPRSRMFTRGFLVVTPGLTIKDRLRVLLPTDAESYYRNRELLPPDMLDDIQRAKIVVTNFHAFKRRETMDVSRVGRELLKGRLGDPISTLEPEGQMLRRVMGDLMGIKNIMVFNDEAHHCYRAKQGDTDDIPLQEGEDKREAGKEAQENNEAARLWITGLEVVQKKVGISRVFDLSATPFFLRGSGHPEGTIFPWTMSDFSLMDAIESGIVKLPRVPVSDNLPDPANEMPKFRELWKHVGKRMPKKDSKNLDAAHLKDPHLTLLINALDALYGHYQKTFNVWREAGQGVPPCFIIVCNNTLTSKLLYDHVSGYELDDGFKPGAYPLFSNFDGNGNPYPRARTLLIDSHQLESGEKLSDDFRRAYAPAIERFRREALERGGTLGADIARGREIDDATLLREIMNTVGRPGTLGADIRCVVSVSMLTEGWDANNVTHILGLRAFGTQLLCEQVIGRALRRRSFELDENGLLPAEYADVFGVPFDFAAEPVIAKPAPPIESIRVHAQSPERDHLEMTFPRVVGYRVEPPGQRLRAVFTEDSILRLTPEEVGPTEVTQSGIIGETAELKVDFQENIRRKSLVMRLTQHYLQTMLRDADGTVPLHFFGQVKDIVRDWMEKCLQCSGGASEIFLQREAIADKAAKRIDAAIIRAALEDSPDAPRILALLDPYNPTGSTKHVNFLTSKKDRWTPDPDRCHLNLLVYDKEWEQQFCREAEKHPRVKCYVKNYRLGFEVPYSFAGAQRTYTPDFMLKVNDGRGEADLLNLVVEVKGQRDEEDKAKSETMHTYWIPGVNRLKSYGRWAFVEIADVYEIRAVLDGIGKESVSAGGGLWPN